MKELKQTKVQNQTSDTANREHRATLLLEAPVEMVWDVWTNPDHIKHWWGPSGFTNTIEKMEVKPGGEWTFTMHSAEGNNYQNKTVFKEVVRHRRIVHEHFDPNFIATIEFEPKGSKTQLIWHKVYETKELFDMVEKEYKAAEGFEQTVAKLKNYLSMFQLR